MYTTLKATAGSIAFFDSPTTMNASVAMEKGMELSSREVRVKQGKQDMQNASLVTCSNEMEQNFKAKKSRSPSFKKGKLDEDVCFKIAGQDKLRIEQEPVKRHGRWYTHLSKTLSVDLKH
ncbi:reverse transcriptase [Plakobranchus ocellatus]|uniref:Reverse transcriptase n=1 Tax=Plakobranchus ocellatus TaxID=259542 RepID=A0AAV4CDS5_9GAST|nr:reverse transcriptase [Plakobranchus ocellatus]